MDVDAAQTAFHPSHTFFAAPGVDAQTPIFLVHLATNHEFKCLAIVVSQFSDQKMQNIFGVFFLADGHSGWLH